MELHASELNAQVRVDANKGSTILAEGACDKGHLVLTVRWAWLLSRTSLLVTSLLTCYLLLTCYYLLTWTCYFITNITELKNKTKPAQKLISRDSWMDRSKDRIEMRTQVFSLLVCSDATLSLNWTYSLTTLVLSVLQMQSLIQQIFIECLLCARHCTVWQGKDREGSLELTFYWWSRYQSKVGCKSWRFTMCNAKKIKHFWHKYNQISKL